MELCPPGFIRLDKAFELEKALAANSKYLPAISSAGLVDSDFDIAVLELMKAAGITRSEAACHIMSVGLKVHTQLMQCIEAGFPPSSPKGDCT